MPTVKELLKAAFRAKWKNARAVARALGVSPAYVGDVISGRRRVSAAFALRLENVAFDGVGFPPESPFYLHGVARTLLYAQADADLSEEERKTQ